MKATELLILSTLITLVTASQTASQSLLNQTWHQSKKVFISSHYGGYSHAKPIFQIGTALKERGHEVAFVSYDLFTDLAKPWGFERISIGQEPVPLAELKVLMKEVTLKAEVEIHTVVDTMWSMSYKSSYLQLRKVFAKEKPDLVMCDVFNFGCVDAAYHLNIPFTVQIPSLGILHSTSGYVSSSLYISPVSTEDAGILDRFQSNIINQVRHLWKEWKFAQKANEDRISVGGVARKEFGFNNIDKGIIFANSFFGVESPKHLPPNVHLVGPLMSREYPPLTPELSSFLGERQKVVYIAFGTVANLDTASVEKILRSVLHLLDDGVIDGVIWPLTQTSEDDFPSEMQINKSTISIRKVLNNEHRDIRILKFAPQFSILSHPNTVLFVSHGGLDSSNEALLTGTKVLSLPVFGDHFYNAGNLEASGVSILMNLRTFTSAEMIEKTTQLVEDKDGKFEKGVQHMQILAHINSKRINHAADVAEHLIYTKSKDDPTKRLYQTPESRMSFWKAHNYDLYLISLAILVGLSWMVISFVIWFINVLNITTQPAKVKKL
ncbi:hypothetical protein K7432_012801 [Basidiobolus ranarum]|uniref:Uncharacterized protein n=1 Tax=Basidiobolus ranarum TaxID=34480 RepID=A0ABR2VRQ1_9FUNG